MNNTSSSTKPEQFITPKGKALWPSLRAPEQFEGQDVGYTIKMMFTKEDTEKFEAFLSEQLEAAKASKDFEGKRWGKEPSLGRGETKEGDVYFKFKMKNSYVSKKTKEVITRHVPIFDAKGKPLPKNIDVGNGSTCKVAYSIYPFYKSSKLYGLSLRLNAVQVLNLVERGEAGTSESYGFGQEEGYSAPCDDEAESPSCEDPATEAEEEDF